MAKAGKFPVLVRECGGTAPRIVVRFADLGFDPGPVSAICAACLALHSAVRIRFTCFVRIVG